MLIVHTRRALKDVEAVVFSRKSGEFEANPSL